MRRAVTAVAAALTALGLAACTAAGGDPSPSATAAPPAPAAPDPGIVPSRTLGTPPTMHVAQGITPPTNRWYSSLAMGDVYQPIFPTPLSWSPAAGGFSFGLPRLSATPAAIFGSAIPDVSVTIDGVAGGPTVVAADPVSVTAAWSGGAGAETVRVALAEGWPVIGVTATSAATLTTDVSWTDEGGWASAEVGGVTYGVVLGGGGSLTAPTTLDLPAEATAQFFAVPADGDGGAFAAALGAPITGVTVGYAGTTTSLAYEGSGDTVLAVPRLRERGDGLTCDLGTYATINGELDVCRGSVAAWTSAPVSPSSQLDLGDISDEQRKAIADALAADVAATPPFPTDSYFGAKALYRAANLLQLADALGEEELAGTLQSQLSVALRAWAEPAGCVRRSGQCFVYDPVMRGMVGVAPAYGSEDFNDHHFHYGYLLYAAGVAAAHDPNLGDEIAPVMDLVAADIASPTATDDFPQVRVFDPFSGHSWASGSAPFADGNNQESSSEAVSAWNGLAQWAAARGDEPMAAQAEWMLSEEAESAVKLWVRPDLAAFPEFEHSVVGIQWSGKRDFATWFSPEPSAVLGIQLIPMAPVAPAYLAPADDAAAAVIRSTVADATEGGYGVQFGDYLLMYVALAGPDDAAEAWTQALSLPDASMDDANSRAYLLAWIAAAS